jgi:hypothetical protein
MTKLYTHTFFKWWDPADLEDLSKSLKVKYKVIPHKGENVENEAALYIDERDELEVKSDNMVAFLSKFRATLSQVKDTPLNLKDIELRDLLNKYYPRDRPTPLPWEWNPEPKLKAAG